MEDRTISNNGKLNGKWENRMILTSHTKRFHMGKSIMVTIVKNN